MLIVLILNILLCVNIIICLIVTLLHIKLLVLYNIHTFNDGVSVCLTTTILIRNIDIFLSKTTNVCETVVMKSEPTMVKNDYQTQLKIY